MLDALEFEYEPKLACNSYRSFKELGAPISFCIGKCRSKCSFFTEHKWITDQCFLESCDHNDPCAECEEKVKRAKVLIAAGHLLRFDTKKSLMSLGRHVDEH